MGTGRMALPNFIVIGASRAGTTSLQAYLAQHPEVHMCPVKSPNHFVAKDALPPWEGPAVQAMARQWVACRSVYEALFDSPAEKRVRGEVSPVYLQSRQAPRRIREACGEIKLVAILRDPVERAYAHFLGRRRDGLEDRREFRQVIEEELSRPLPDEVAFGCYLGCSRYHHFLKDYLELFPTEHVRIYLFEDLQADAGALLADLFGFLEVDARFTPDTSRRHNRSGEIAGPLRRMLWTRSVRLRTALRPHLPAVVRDAAQPFFREQLVKPPPDAGLRARAIAALRPDVERLAERIGRNLSHWLATA